MGKLLITGGAGYVGSHLAHYLVREGGLMPQDLVVFDNLSAGHLELLPEGVLFIDGDLRNKRDILAVFESFEVDAVFHLAGILNVAESMSRPSEYFSNNVIGGVHLLEAMVAGNCRKIVFSSSCTVYGQAKSPVIEEIDCNPISPYGESKLQFERWLAWYARIHNVKSVSLRYFNAAGAGFGIGEWHDPEIHLIPSVLEVVAGKRSALAIYGNDYDTPDGTCVRDYVHVCDLVEVHAEALKYNMQRVGSEMVVFNIGLGRGVSVKQVVDLAERVTGRSVSILYEARRPGDVPAMYADINKVARELGWRPSYSIEDCIGDAWKWMQVKRVTAKAQVK